MSDELNRRIKLEQAARADAESALKDYVSALEVTRSHVNVPSVSVTELSPTPSKPSFVKDVTKGALNVAKVLWQVPAARGLIATLLVRFGLPGTLVAIGMAVGDKLAG